jgi:phosphomethylpyrimidine synthase
MKENTLNNEEIITREALPGSRKVYVPARIHNISVAMREISLDCLSASSPRCVPKTPARRGTKLTLYDTSGPYSDPAIKVDVRSGAAAHERGMDFAKK